MPDQTQVNLPSGTERWEIRWCTVCGQLITISEYRPVQRCPQCNTDQDQTLLVGVMRTSVIQKTAYFVYTDCACAVVAGAT